MEVTPSLEGELEAADSGCDQDEVHQTLAGDAGEVVRIFF